MYQNNIYNMCWIQDWMARSVAQKFKRSWEFRLEPFSYLKFIKENKIVRFKNWQSFNDSPCKKTITKTKRFKKTNNYHWFERNNQPLHKSKRHFQWKISQIEKFVISRLEMCYVWCVSVAHARAHTCCSIGHQALWPELI